MNASLRVKQDFQFYLETPLDMVGKVVGAPPLVPDPRGKSALECWVFYDTHGKTMPCAEPEVLDKVRRSKASINLMVKLWAEDLAGALLSRAEVQRYTEGWPTWVARAVEEQAAKLAQRQVGFVPSFIRKSA